MRGAQWEAQLVDLARLLGWKVAHFRAAQRADGTWRTPVSGDGAGWPDLSMARRGRLVFAEAKASPRARTTPQQEAWLAELGAVPGVEVYVWRPADWDEIVATLR